MAKKKLTVSVLKKLDSQFNEKKEIDVQGYKVVIDLKFRPTKIQSLIYELQDKILYCQNNNIEFGVADANNYLLLLIVKYFTDIDISDDFAEQLRVLDIMIDNGFLEPILNAFPHEELKKVIDYIAKTVDGLNELSKQAPAILAEEVTKDASVQQS